MPNKVGRPKVENRRGSFLLAAVTSKEKEVIQQYAIDHNTSVSSVLREAAWLFIIKQTLKEESEK